MLIAEACNHNRITDICNDIGMVREADNVPLVSDPRPFSNTGLFPQVQIPKHIARVKGEDVVLDHSFGREYPELESGALGKYKLAIHCGGCMIDTQKMRAR